MRLSYDKVSITATIAVVALSVGLLLSLIAGASETITVSLASGLTGYIGGRATNTKIGGDRNVDCN